MMDEPERWERQWRNYALLQAAALLYRQWPSSENVELAVDLAKQLLAEIEKEEK